MPEPILITVLITTVGALITQIFKIYLDYKQAQHQNHDYFSSIKSNCCTTILESKD
jgi:hypothetical protein